MWLPRCNCPARRQLKAAPPAQITSRFLAWIKNSGGLRRQHPRGGGEIPADAVLLNEALARQLGAKPGDTILLRAQKPSLLSRDAPLTPQEDFSVAMRLTVKAVVSDEQFGRFSLQANQLPPFNAFVQLGRLQERIGQQGRANLLLAPQLADGEDASINDIEASLRKHWQLADAALDLRAVPGTNVLELIAATASSSIHPWSKRCARDCDNCAADSDLFRQRTAGWRTLNRRIRW